MTLYITPDNKLHDDNDGIALELPSWPEIARLATGDEISAILNPTETTEQRRERIKGELDALERDALMPRGARETFIALCEQQGQLANLSKEQLYAANPFYKGLIDRDNEARALRAQL